MLLLAFVVVSVGCVHTENSDRLKPYIMASDYDNEPALSIELPGSFKYEKFRGVDFDVSYFRDRRSSNFFGIYLGHHPSLRASKSELDLAETEGQVGRVAVKWRHWTEEDRFRGETIVKGFFNGPAQTNMHDFVLHIFLTSDTEGNRGQLEKYFESLRPVPNPPKPGSPQSFQDLRRAMQ